MKELKSIKVNVNVICSLFLLIITIISQFFLHLNLMPALVILILAIAGSLNNKKSIQYVIFVALILLVIIEKQGLYSYFIKSIYTIFPLLIGLLLSQRLKQFKSVYYAIIIFILPILIFLQYDNQLYKLVLFSILYIILHYIYFTIIKANDRVYLMSFSAMLLISFLDQLIGYYLDAFSKSLLLPLFFIPINLLLLFAIYRSAKEYSTLWLHKLFNIFLVSIFAVYLMLSYFKSTQRVEQPKILTLKTDITELNLYNKGSVQKVNISDQNEITLHFWATWCGPCIRRMNTIEKVKKNQYYVSFEDSTTVNKFIKKRNYGFPIYYTPKKGLKGIANEITMFPSTAIFNNDSVTIIKGSVDK